MEKPSLYRCSISEAQLLMHFFRLYPSDPKRLVVQSDTAQAA